MPTFKMDANEAEHGLRSIERLLEDGDPSMAAVALDLVAPGIEALMDERQSARLSAVRAAVAQSSEAGEAEGSDAPVVLPFRRP